MNAVNDAQPLSATAPRRVMIMAGGTGGHVYPALAVADWLAQRQHEVCWLGTQRGIEARVVPQAGYPIEWLHVQGLRGKSLLTWALAPLKLVRALGEALAAMRRRQPDVVLGMGGFVSGPGGVAARLSRRPLVLHEQNAIAGLSNRLLTRVASAVFEGFPQSFDARVATTLIGNPVREAIADIAPPAQRFAAREGQSLQVLVLGGSLGARSLNKVIPEALAKLAPAQRPLVRHQTGARWVDEAREHYTAHGVDVQLDAFINDMASAYAEADLVICRAGALTIAELTAAGVGAVLVPYPHAVDDHQAHNSRFMVDAEAAIMVRDDALDASALAARLAELLADRERLLDMAQRARGLARPDATAALGQACLDAAAAAGRRSGGDS